MGTVITVTSGKGGTGKTTVTGGVASCLARLGKTVLCIDMDIGLRNLDISLGLSDRALMDFADVALGNCPLARAAVSHPDLPNLSLLTAPMRLPPHVTAGSIRALLRTARDRYDYIFIDCPAGLGPGFQLATCGADRALVVATNDASSLRDAQRAVEELYHLRQVHLVMNRIQPKLLRELRTTIDDAMDAAGLPLIGVIPEDRRVILAANMGRPLILEGRRGAANACLNIAKRIEGYRVPIMRIR
ncbi:septum site-determining protein MinD [Pseudoflavonifractor capillosus]|uniref:septum site-determining protein MinD n=1 Tax=Pseudoflavonifractor capillosus TaxID=106588 RepID=UPI00195A68C2|nr:septum site-determining protein MinD [Pseudoflavonifractor capillosus]MBM6680813.1 septum site-determining protein MinD [Pseudoflavonifractor capillosus]MBS5549915.1 septum site-determining protein MinD [Oscillospiraceae bacterium]HIW26916.1 septum site-determining protein MinD [Candidatus Lawsonibacter pullicola]